MRLIRTIFRIDDICITVQCFSPYHERWFQVRRLLCRANTYEYVSTRVSSQVSVCLCGWLPGASQLLDEQRATGDIVEFHGVSSDLPKDTNRSDPILNHSARDYSNTSIKRKIVYIDIWKRLVIKLSLIRGNFLSKYKCFPHFKFQPSFCVFVYKCSI